MARSSLVYVLVGAFIGVTAWFARPAPAAASDGVIVTKVEGKPPQAGATVVGSGSGIVVGPGLVLTNRHVVAGTDGALRPGLRIRTGANYAEHHDARVVWLCRNYDLALVETSVAVTSTGLPVLSTLPPLGSRVTAYGFPMGDEFGIGLTATGGQITRHPVPVDDENDETKDVKRSMWHDAVSTGGSSGGPLFSPRGVVVGIHWGSFTRNGNALCVPSLRVAEFLKAAGVERHVRLVAGLDEAEASWTGDPKQATVYIEVLGEAGGAPAKAKPAGPSAFDAVQRYADEMIDKLLPTASDRELAEIKSEGFKAAFPVTAPHDVKSLTFCRLKTTFTLLQVREDWWLIDADGVTFKHHKYSEEQNAEWRAKFGEDPIRGLKMDDLVYVGKPQEYQTVGGTTAVYFPLFDGMVWFGGPKNLKRIEAEQAHRQEAAAAVAMRRAELERREREELAEKEERAYNQKTELIAKKYRRIFNDSTGTYRVDALCVGVGTEGATLYIYETKKTISIELAKLSPEDRRWITENERWIKLNSARLQSYVSGLEK